MGFNFFSVKSTVYGQISFNILGKVKNVRTNIFIDFSMAEKVWVTNEKNGRKKWIFFYPARHKKTAPKIGRNWSTFFFGFLDPPPLPSTTPTSQKEARKMLLKSKK